MDEELMNLANEMSGQLEPGSSYAPIEVENEVEHEEPTESIEDVGNDAEDSDKQEEAGKEDESSSESDEEAESEEESEESDNDEETEAEESDDEDESNDEPSNDDGEAVHQVTVDGEEVEVSLKDLKENYAGQQAWDKKFQELGTERTAHQAEVNKFNENANQFQELAKEGKAQEALDLVIELAGLNGNQFKEAYVKQLAPTIAEYLELSPEEREQRALKQQNEQYRAQHEKAQLRQTEEAAALQQRTEIESVMTKHDMSPERFEELQKELIEAEFTNLTAETVGQYHVLKVHQGMAVEALKAINPDLVKDQSAVDYLLSLQNNNPGMKKEELQAKAESAFKDALAERVKKDSKAAKPRKKGNSSSAKKKQIDEILTFDDLDNINVLDLL